MCSSKLHNFKILSSWHFQSKIKGKEEIQNFAFLELVLHFQSKKEGENIYNLKALIFSAF